MPSPTSVYQVQLLGKWRPLFRPTRFCQYVNDHTVFKDRQDNWRLIGTAGPGNYAFYKERSFIQGLTPNLLQEMNETGLPFASTPSPGIKIAPYVFRDKKKPEFHLFFASLETIFHYLSSDGQNWQKTDPAVRSIWPYLRDPHIIKTDQNYFLYLTDFGNQISLFKSPDLYSWKKTGTALKLGRGIPRSFNSSCESPFIFHFQNQYFLFTTIVPSPFGRRPNYNHTVVFSSSDPTNFGFFSKDKNNTSQIVNDLNAHAPEVINDDGKLFLTTCGWKDFPKPRGITQEGVFIRRIKFQKVSK